MPFHPCYGCLFIAFTCFIISDCFTQNSNALAISVGRLETSVGSEAKKAAVGETTPFDISDVPDPPLDEFPRPPKGGITNVNVDFFATVDQLFEALELTTCRSGKRNEWRTIQKKMGIRTCLERKETPEGKKVKKKTEPIQKFGSESGVVIGEKGSRELFDINMKSCDGRTFRFRFTYDRNEENCGFEGFLKPPVGEVLGLGISRSGTLIKEIPRDLALDKHENQTSAHGTDVITSGMGCFNCHPRVSEDYDTKGWEDFWKGANLPNQTSEVTLTDYRRDVQKERERQRRQLNGAKKPSHK